MFKLYVTSSLDKIGHTWSETVDWKRARDGSNDMHDVVGAEWRREGFQHFTRNYGFKIELSKLFLWSSFIKQHTSACVYLRRS